MDAVTSLPADPQAAEPADPGIRALHHPADTTETGPVRRTTAGNDGLDPALPQQAAVLVEVVAPIGEQHAWPVAGRPVRSLTRGIASSRGRSWVTSWRFPPVSVCPTAPDRR